MNSRKEGYIFITIDIYIYAFLCVPFSAQQLIHNSHKAFITKICACFLLNIDHYMNVRMTRWKYLIISFKKSIIGQSTIKIYMSAYRYHYTEIF